MVRKLFILLTAAILLVTLCSSEKCRRIRNDAKAIDVPYPKPSVNFRMPGNRHGFMRIVFEPDSTQRDSLYNTFSVIVDGMRLNAPQAGRLQRYLLRDGFPTDSDMPLFLWINDECIEVSPTAHRVMTIRRMKTGGVWYGHWTGRWVADSLIVP